MPAFEGEGERRAGRAAVRDPAVRTSGDTDRRTVSRDRRASRRRILWSSVSAIAVSTFAFAWMATAGSWNFLQQADFSNFYDVQARSILDGRLSMPSGVLWIEGIHEHGATYMYYGPFPALLRIPVLLFTHSLDGRLTQPSMVLAFVVGLAGASHLFWRARPLVRADTLVSWPEAFLGAAWVLVVGLGSVLLFLGSTALVYEEAELWGAALTIATLDALAGFVLRPSGWRIAATGVLATMAMLTRGSVAAGAMAAMCVVAAVYLVAWEGAQNRRFGLAAARIVRLSGVQVRDRIGRRAVELLVAVAVPAGLYIGINEVKFATPFSVPFNRQLLSSTNVHREAVLAANGGSLFGIKFLPSDLLAYVRPDALATTQLFPWFTFPARDTVIGHLLYDTLDWTSSVPASMPVLFLASLLGLYVLFRPDRRFGAIGTGPDMRWGSDPHDAPPPPTVTALRILAVGGAVGIAGVLDIAFITERYLADVMPFLVVCSVVGWHVAWAWVRRLRPSLRTLVAVALAVLVLFELWVNFSLSIFYQRVLGNDATMGSRAGLVAFEERLHADLGLPPEPRADLVAHLPTSGAPLSLAVVGSCDGLYQYDGHAWEPVELGKGGGAFDLQVTFPRTQRGRRQPLVVAGAPGSYEVVALIWLGGDRYGIDWLQRGGSTWFLGGSFSAQAGSRHDVRVFLNAATRSVLVYVGGQEVYAIGQFYDDVGAPTHVRLGSAPAGVSTTPTFGGTIRSRPVTTPICSQLLRSER